MRPMDKPKVVRAVPRSDRNDLYHTVDGYDFIYENPTYGKADVVRPGFFNTFRDELKVGMMIECRLGDIADGIEASLNVRWYFFSKIFLSEGCGPLWLRLSGIAYTLKQNFIP